MVRRISLVTLVLAALGLGGCVGGTAGPVFTARVVSIVPAGGATNVAPDAPIVITFSHPMRDGTERYAALHAGDASGAVVSGVWTWSQDATMLTFMPSQPLSRQTQYTLHLGGGMRAMDGGLVDYAACVGQYGGQWATSSMMSGGMMAGGMMGDGWRDPMGTYGMVFSFTTA